MDTATLSGSQIIARSLKDQGVQVIFGLVGIPVAEACIAIGIRFISFRNEQAASYAASAYGYLTGRPGVLLVVGGPGVIHAMPGIHHALSNSFPLVVLAGASESFQQSMGAFQELDQVAFLRKDVKFAARPVSISRTPVFVEQAFRSALYGRPGPTYIDLPGDYIQGSVLEKDVEWRPIIDDFPRPPAPKGAIRRMVDLLISAKRPLIVIGKGAQFSRSELALLDLLSVLPIPFLPTPMGKGHLPDDHPLCIASARSAALKGADVVLVLGARLNWILHYGQSPKWASAGQVKWLRVDICPDAIDDNQRAEVGVVADVRTVVEQLSEELRSRNRKPDLTHQEDWGKTLRSSMSVNAHKTNEKTIIDRKSQPSLMKYHQAFGIIFPLLPKDHIFVAEGANTLDIGRSFFPVENPRSRLDSGSTATMGVGMGFAIAAAIYEKERVKLEGETTTERKVVAVVGDSAFGFSAMEVETAARNKLGILVIVMNNSGVYHGLSTSAYTSTPLSSLPPTALLPGVRYDLISEACGGKGFLVRTPDELATAVKEAMKEENTVSVVNVVMDPGKGGKLEFAWLKDTKKESKL
ncbi:2-hydroxyacyl-lyase [Phaffia rhodozyma]|uniref:2-hydroxyacyl-CoA lyase n=1 Tax=Phaffia rhodozyma TaxID=264483 RepID=A0A0F7SU98_PHARH|nr:2-hydroxyacyl-lyase [Phaffia rhodozyma]